MRVVQQGEAFAVQSQKSETGQVKKCNILLQELGGQQPPAALPPRRPHQQRLPLAKAQRRRRGRENLGPHAGLRRRHFYS